MLRLRERTKEEKETELRALNLERARRESALSALVAELDQLGSDLNAQTGLTLAPMDLKLWDEYQQLLIASIERKRRELAALNQQAERKRQELTEAMREVKSLEILRHRLAEQFRRAQNLAEQKFLDELGQARRARRVGGQ